MKALGIVLIFVLIGCSQTARDMDLTELTGYWEIEKVVFHNGNTKTYGISTSVDYFELQPDSTGFRKKLQPQLNGRFLATDHKEDFEISWKDHQFKIQYGASADSREETIISIDKNRLVIKNNNNLTYFYKRFVLVSVVE